MPDRGMDIDESAPVSLFLDPFRGVPLEVTRQPSDISDLSGYVRPHAFSKHRDTLARVQWPRSNVDDEGFHSDEDECSELHTTDDAVTACGWSSRLPVASRLPAEVLHQIFGLLQPCDFEAARHVCRSWLVTSLDRRLANTMMKRAGCYSAFLNDLNRSQQPDDTNEHWLASKRLATESRLSAAWHGSSLYTVDGHTSSRLAVRQTVDFTQLVANNTTPGATVCDRFTVSTCGKFLLATFDRNIWVYAISIGNATFDPLVQLVAETKVIAVSMDTSARRYAVAALLEGRMGACWEIDDIVLNGAVGSLYSTITEETRASEQDTLSTQIIPDSPLVLRHEHHEISIIAEGMDIDLPQSIQIQEFEPLSHVPSRPRNLEEPSSSAIPSLLTKLSGFPVRTVSSAVYRNLGTKNDAPRSVAICPQRKCAAFGCKAGIELHWVDASTGAELNRWFPLAAPSDHLYFLPQRPGIDSAKKLRLISSAANPALESIKDARFESTTRSNASASTGRTRARSMMKLFQGSHRFSLSSSNSSQHVYPRMDCDHYRAVPLSDGQHMLFTDPKSGLLCLGSDAPLGGPTKLVRKACLVPPQTAATDHFESPIYYSAATDLKWGVRVVAAYADGRIVLYNVPSDCFERLRHIRTSPEIWDEWNGGAGQSDLAMDAFMLNRDTAMANAGQDELFKALQIDGALLGYVDADVEAFAVDAANGGFKLWSFHSSGQATQMDIYVPRDHHISSQFVGHDGLVHPKLLTPLPRAILKGHANTPYDTKDQEDYFGSHVRFIGMDGCCDHSAGSTCGPMVHKNEIDYTDFPRDEGISMTPGASDDENDERPLQVELLTDWRAESLLRPYIVNVAWIEAH